MMGIFEYSLILLSSTPAMAFWIAVIIFGAVMLRRGGGRAERFLIAGGSIKLMGNLLIIPSLIIRNWLIYNDYSLEYIQMISTNFSIFGKVVSMAGIICLIYAFWVKFNKINPEPMVSLPNN